MGNLPMLSPQDPRMAPGMMPGMAMGMPQQPQLPPPEQWEPAQAPKFTKQFIDKASEFIRYEMKAAQQGIRNKLQRWKLLEDIYRSRRGLMDWHGVARLMDSVTPEVITNKRWQSDFVMSVAPVVHSYSDRMFNVLFATDQYCNIRQEPTLGGSVEDPVYPTSAKFQALLLHKNRESRFKTRSYEIIQDDVLFGTCAAKAFYHRKQNVQWKRNPITNQPTPIPQTREFPIIEAIPLHSILPDVRARHSDSQRWTGVGHRVQVSFSAVVKRFQEGHYNLNFKEFTQKFGKGVQFEVPEYPQIWLDRYLLYYPDDTKLRIVTIWEWQGAVALEDGTEQEVIATFVTPRFDDDPVSSICIRMEPGPVMPTGHRSILVSAFTPIPAVFGLGAVETNLDVIFYMSSLINSYIDNVRLSTNIMYKYNPNSSAGQELKDNPGVWPGKAWPVDKADDITLFEPAQFPTQGLQQVLGLMTKMYAERTNASESTLAMTSREKSATEDAHISQMATVPLDTRLKIFVENLFEPYLNMAVGMLQRNLTDTQVVPVMGPAGVETSQQLTPDEIRTGRYYVSALMNKQDQTKIAKAQSMERMSQVVFKPEMQQALKSENRQVSAYQWLRQYGDLMGVEHLDRLIPLIGGPEQAAADMLKSVPPPILQALLRIPPQLLQMFMQVPEPQLIATLTQLLPKKIQETLMAAASLQPQPQMMGGGGPQGQAPQAHQLGIHGSPMGPGDHSDIGAMMQQLQLQAGNPHGGMMP